MKPVPEQNPDAELCIGTVQLADTGSVAGNLDLAESLIRQAAGQGARVILSPELLETPYFCQTENPRWFASAVQVGQGPGYSRFQSLARELGVVLPFSFFERSGQAYFNSVVVFDADGCDLGVYRKSHIPDGPGYEEKFYFNPGDTGLRVFETGFGTIGVGICWDQWFPEVARILALQGAECILYPTAIGSEPAEPEVDSRKHWQRVMQGHAGANLVPIAAANRYGVEVCGTSSISFYGSSFITDAFGEVVAEAAEQGESVQVVCFERNRLRHDRANWGFFRDRRPDFYQRLLQY